MADLTFLEKRTLERLFGMGSGYVLDFSDRTFQEYVGESVGVDILSDKYRYSSGSKANRLRCFCKIEPNHRVGKLIFDLGHYSKALQNPPEQKDLDECFRIAERLLQGAPILDNLGEGPEFDERTFQLLLKSLQEAINRNKPETALDRLHTYVVKYMRFLCERHGVGASRDQPLHSLVGGYIKYLKAAGLIEADMTERILMSSIKNLESFNRVRNDHSLAHDNEVLNYNESLLVFNHVVSVIRFIEAIERTGVQTEAAQADREDDIPF
jgi:hypothetical protein